MGEELKKLPDGAFGVLKTKNGLVLVKHAYGARKWSLPGGGVEPGETPEKAVIREFLEETGIEVKITSKIGVFHARKNTTDAHLFLVEQLHHKEEASYDKKEIEGLGYFNIDSVYDLRDFGIEIYPAQKIIISAWILIALGVFTTPIDDYQSNPDKKELLAWMEEKPENTGCS